MRARRHNRPGQPDDFEIQTNDTFMDIWKQFSALFFDVIIGISSIALVVGGVVIMNIMLVSVTERTREIGVRKSLGARQADIKLQFLIEAVLMAAFGGAIGIVLGAGATELLSRLFGIGMRITAHYVAVALVVSSAVGIASGWYPASRAARLDPVVALRAE
jgi:putative ABC transport system permease protein